MIARSCPKPREEKENTATDQSIVAHARHRVLRENVQKDIANIVHGMHSRTLYLAIVDFRWLRIGDAHKHGMQIRSY